MGRKEGLIMMVGRSDGRRGAIVPPPAMRENAGENPRFSRTLGFTIQLDTVLKNE